MSLALPKLTSIDPSNAMQVEEVLRSAPTLVFAQTWLAIPHPKFQPGIVRLGVYDDAVWVWAQLQDRAMVTISEPLQQPVFLGGDVFEVFVQVHGSADYQELHVSPANQRLQLHYSDTVSVSEVRARFAANDPDPLAIARVEYPLFESWTWIDSNRTRWSVLMRIPLTSLIPSGSPDALRISCCRYDRDTAGGDPVISSTSPHPVADFHRPSEWCEVFLPRN